MQTRSAARLIALLLLFFRCSLSSRGFETRLDGLGYENAGAGRISKRALKVEDDKEPDPWAEYLEETENVLFGSETLILVARRNQSVNDPKNRFYITYQKRPFVVSDANNIQLLIRKREVEPPPSIYYDDSVEYDDYVLEEAVRSWNNYDPEKVDAISGSLSAINYPKENVAGERLRRSVASSHNDSDVVYIKILVTVDYDTYLLHNKDVVLMATYISALLNGVDLRFRQMINPKIRLNLAGIIVPEETEGAHYLEWYQNGLPSKIAKTIIYDTILYFSNVFPKFYDVILGIVKLPLNFESLPVRGKPYKPGNWPNQTAMVLVSDNGGLSSITTITTMLALVFGSGYDSDSIGCPMTDGYLMNSYEPERGGINGFFFSKCSIDAMQRQLNNNLVKKSLITKPKVGKKFSKKLPGRVFNRNEQCLRMKKYYKLDEDTQNNCLKLTCKFCDHFLSWDFLCSRYVAPYYPAEGSSCGEGRICLKGRCIHESEIKHWK